MEQDSITRVSPYFVILYVTLGKTHYLGVIPNNVLP